MLQYSIEILIGNEYLSAEFVKTKHNDNIEVFTAVHILYERLCV